MEGIMVIIGGTILVYVIWKIVKMLNRAKGLVWELIYSDRFLLKPYSQSDMSLLKAMRKYWTYTAKTSQSELVILKWYLLRHTFNTLYSQWINEDTSLNILKAIDSNMPKYFKYELKWFSDEDIEKRFLFYNKVLLNMNEFTGWDIAHLFSTWQIDGWTSYDISNNMHFDMYLREQLQSLNFLIDFFTKQPENIKL